MTLRDALDRAIVYGGGSGVVVSSQTLQAQPPENYSVSLMQYPLPILDITVADLCTVIATLVIISKGTMDIVSFFERRADRISEMKRDKKEGGKL